LQEEWSVGKTCFIPMRSFGPDGKANTFVEGRIDKWNGKLTVRRMIPAVET